MGGTGAGSLEGAGDHFLSGAGKGQARVEEVEEVLFVEVWQECVMKAFGGLVRTATTSKGVALGFPVFLDSTCSGLTMMNLRRKQAVMHYL